MWSRQSCKLKEELAASRRARGDPDMMVLSVSIKLRAQGVGKQRAASGGPRATAAIFPQGVLPLLIGSHYGKMAYYPSQTLVTGMDVSFHMSSVSLSALMRMSQQKRQERPCEAASVLHFEHRWWFSCPWPFSPLLDLPSLP